MKYILWAREELILVLSLYFEHHNKVSAIPDSTIDEYSKICRAMHPTNASKNPKFRSAKSIRARLYNFQSCDPSWIERGHKGLQAGSAVNFKNIWDEFYKNPDEVVTLAGEIKDALKASPRYQTNTANDSIFEGQRVLRIHQSRERKPQRQKKINSFITTHGYLFCECCGTTGERYEKSIRESIFEVHHDIPLALASNQVETKIEDLLILCASCHKAIHGYEEVPSVDEMKEQF